MDIKEFIGPWNLAIDAAIAAIPEEKIIDHSNGSLNNLNLAGYNSCRKDVIKSLKRLKK